MHSIRVNRYKDVVVLSFITALATLLSACAAQQLRTAESTELPDVFFSPERRPHFHVSVSPSLLKRRILNSKCTGSGQTAEISSRALGSSGLFLDQGRTPTGVSWFLVRDRDSPDLTYCGLAMIPADDGADVAVVNVRHSELHIAHKAVQFGDFFCKCKQLAH